jgi:hypothetical protein
VISIMFRSSTSDRFPDPWPDGLLAAITDLVGRLLWS